MLIYRTHEWEGFSKHDYYWNEYRLEGDSVVKYTCNTEKVFDGHENEWRDHEWKKASWKTDDPAMPEWLRKYI